MRRIDGAGGFEFERIMQVDAVSLHPLEAEVDAAVAEVQGEALRRLEEWLAPMPSRLVPPPPDPAWGTLEYHAGLRTSLPDLANAASPRARRAFEIVEQHLTLCDELATRARKP